ncbi:MAG: anthranilate phosphoribosyltransferase, partial [Chitinophagaceae bacterium]|nr:anthranilate phosphoribosyltransferase [Chitinophagaceae bacterium]
MKKVLNYLFEHRTLTREDARQILVSIGKGEYNEHELSAFMTVYLMRSITLDELMGFRDALLELSVSIDFQHRQVMDVVGTGGDGKNTFNISTLACFIIAGAGFPVAKHGNYGASSISGASNLMERIGYVFKNDQDALRKELDASNMCFLHAPFFHPALKTVGPIRKNLKVRTFFNLLGPVVNPSRPAFQLIGVYNLEIARLYNYLLQSENSTFAIVHSLDGYDEISLTADSKVITKLGEKVYHPNALGGMVVRPDEIYGGETVDAAVEKFMCILQGKGTASQNAVVCSNAAMGLMLSGKFQNYESAYESAK